jgi:hypothetical protein
VPSCGQRIISTIAAGMATAWATPPTCTLSGLATSQVTAA